MSQETHQPKTVIYRTDILNHLQAGMGILDFDAYFDNAFSKYKYAMDFIDETMENISNGVIDLKDQYWKLKPRSEPIWKMDKIWNGTTWLGIIKSKNDVKVVRKELFYKEPPSTFKVQDQNGNWIDWKREVIKCPIYSGMVPVGQLKDDTWGIRQRNLLPTKEAWESSQYGTIIEDGNFKFNTSEGSIPKFESHEMNEITNYTSIMSRPVNDEWSRIFNFWMNRHLNKFRSDVQKIIDFLTANQRRRVVDDDDFDDEDNDKGNFVM